MVFQSMSRAWRHPLVKVGKLGSVWIHDVDTGEMAFDITDIPLVEELLLKLRELQAEENEHGHKQDEE